MFGDKFTKLSAAVGRKEHTEAEITEMNAQLLEKGVTGLAIMPQSDITGSLAAIDAANAAKNTATSALATMTAERDDWKEKAEVYGAQPGAVKTTVKKKKDAVTGFTSNANADYNQRANRAIGVELEEVN